MEVVAIIGTNTVYLSDTTWQYQMINLWHFDCYYNTIIAVHSWYAHGHIFLGYEMRSNRI